MRDGATEPGARAEVLVVDDDEDVNDALREVLTDAGYGVASVRNGREALEYLDDHSPDLILLDLRMPVMDGYTFRRQQQRDLRLAAIPTIVLTADVIDHRFADLGVAGWLGKPPAVGALVRAIERHRTRPHAAVAEAHSVQFYDDDAVLAGHVGAYLKEGLDRGDGAIAIATPGHWGLIAASLREAEIDVERAQERGQLLVLDARATLESFTVAGAPSEDGFTRGLGEVVARAQRQHPAIRAYGEMVNLLWEDGDVASALALEDFWNRLLHRIRCPLRCAYSAPRSAGARAHAARIRAAHAHVAAAG